MFNIFKKQVGPFVQPPDAFRIKWKNPISQGLVVAFTGNEPVNLVNDTMPVLTGNMTPTSSEYRGLSNDGSGNNYLDFAIDPVSQFTCVSFAKATNPGIYRQMWDDDNFPLAPRAFQFRWSSSNQVECAGFNAGVPTSLAVSGNISVPHLSALVIRDGLVSLFYNKTKVTGVQATNTPTDNTVRFGRFSGTGASQLFSGVVYLAYFFNRPLSDEEIFSLSDNPWQLFEDGTSPFIFPVASGIVNASASGLVRINGSGSSAKIVSQTISGKLLARGSETSSKISNQTASGLLSTKTSETYSKTSISTASGLLSDKGSLTYSKISNSNFSAGLSAKVVNTASKIDPGVVNASASGLIKTVSTDTTAKIAFATVSGLLSAKSSIIVSKISINECSSRLSLKQLNTTQQLAPGIINASVNGSLTLKTVNNTSKIATSLSVGRIYVKSSVNAPLLALNSLADYTIPYILRDNTIKYGLKGNIVKI